MEGGAGNPIGRSGLHSLRRAPGHAQPHHLNTTKYWHGGERDSVRQCVRRFASICKDGGHSGFCEKVEITKKTDLSPETMLRHTHRRGNTGPDKQFELEIASISSCR